MTKIVKRIGLPYRYKEAAIPLVHRRRSNSPIDEALLTLR